jgi:pimeloyl-ACP methyl ester carboxylesterase
MSVTQWLIAVPSAIVAAIVLVLGGMIAFGTAEQPGEMASVTKAAQSIDRSDLPPVSRYTARDGATLAYRAYPGDPARVAVLIHGSVEGSSVMHAVAKTLQAQGMTVYAPDMRGHGGSGQRGDIDYIGQLDDDLADFAAAIRPAHPHAAFELIGFSSGGSFTARIAGGRYGELFDRYVLLSPTLPPGSPTVRPNSGGWVKVGLPRAIAISILSRFGVHWFDGLPIVLFAVAPGSTDVTSAYSFRLALNFGADRDNYLRDFRNTRRPMTVIIGSDDEINIADRYAPLLMPIKPDIAIKILPGIRHINLVSDPQALSAIAAAAAMPLEHKADAN